MTASNRKPVPSVEELKVVTEKLVAGTINGYKIETVKHSDGPDEQVVTLPVEELEALLSAKEKAERPLRVKAKDLVVNNKRRIVLAGVTLASLAAAGYAVTHKDTILDTVEHATENAAEKAEHGARDVKKSARQARTGSTSR